jgi:hypothetical protein
VLGLSGADFLRRAGRFVRSRIVVERGADEACAAPVTRRRTAMRFMIIVKATADSEAGVFPEDDTLMAAMAAYHDDLQKAGVLLDGSGLKPSAEGWRVHYGADGSRRVVDGPFAETKELVAGYTLIQVRSRDEAMEWARRFPAPMGERVPASIEVRPLYELDDLPATASRADPDRRVPGPAFTDPSAAPPNPA